MNNLNDQGERCLANMDQEMSVEAGRTIFERMTPEARPRWAANILLLVVERLEINCSPVNRIIHVACHPAEWKDGHRAFDEARSLLLKSKKVGQLRNEGQNMLLATLSLAELVAKVTYNETDPEDPFDEDSGWWIPRILKSILKQLNDEVFSRRMIAALYASQI